MRGVFAAKTAEIICEVEIGREQLLLIAGLARQNPADWSKISRNVRLWQDKEFGASLWTAHAASFFFFGREK
ncbi:MAG TPA: hypothetical protein VFB72_20850 [Verrucomicrobiae bacterium]|nr:hypothetical protein [Verrucomicrobiae bacterium]